MKITRKPPNAAKRERAVRVLYVMGLLQGNAGTQHERETRVSDESSGLRVGCFLFEFSDLGRKLTSTTIV